jgi:hypothetical protein
MIRIGLSHREKQKEINNYLQDHEIKKIFCFYFKSFPVKYKVECEIEYIEYADIEMYKFFYRLLEEINETSLIIIDGCMRTQNRSELIYNCAHHYLNQTPHRIIFEYFPIIESKADMMILFDLENKGKYKGKGFDYVYLQNEDIRIRPVKIKLDTIPVETTEKDQERYEKKKQQLFDGLGDKDPDTIPRNLQILVGDMKRKAIETGKQYVARNKRFKLDNVLSYQEITSKGEYIVIDMHYRRLNMNDFLKVTGMSKVKYLSTILPVDTVIINDFVKWKARLMAIYAQASLYK